MLGSHTHTPNGRSTGVSLPELMVVIAILALAVMVLVPLAANRVHDAKLRSAVTQFAGTLRAARMIAVSLRGPVTVTVTPEPDNTYGYVDIKGLTRTIELPPGVRIDGSSDAAITFLADGSVTALANTHFEATLSGGAVKRWRVETQLTGSPRIHDEGQDVEAPVLP